MLIVCPSCATSYMIDQASLGADGRMVRCARCQATWFAGGSEAEVEEFVTGVIAEAETAMAGGGEAALPPAYAADDRFSVEPAETAEEEQIFAQHDDAEPAAIDDAPSIAPAVEHPADQLAAGEAEAEPDEFASYAARRERMKSRRQQARRSSRWTAVLLVLFAFNVAVVGARTEVVRYLPQTASLFAAIGLPVNLRHLIFDKVRIARGDGASLTVSGTIVSTADKPVAVPHLRFAARNASGQEIYAWTEQPSKQVLKPGEKLPFHSTLAKPPQDAKDVLVRFTDAKTAVKTVGSIETSPPPTHE